MKTKNLNSRANNNRSIKRIGPALKKASTKLAKRIINLKLKNPFSPSKRQIEEELIRAEETRAHRERLISETIKNGLKVNHENIGHRVFPELDCLQRIAADIYISSLLRVYGDDLNMKEEKFVQKVRKEFKDMDSHTKNKYIMAALLEDPLHADTVSSNAYLVFVDLHCEEQMYVGTGRARKLRGGVTTPSVGHIKAEAAEMWKKMMPDQKLPFYLKAYLGTFAPRTLDGAILNPDLELAAE
jgi:hypothetical protein